MNYSTLLSKAVVLLQVFFLCTLQGLGQADGWFQIGNDIHGDLEDEFFGQALSISAEGDIVAIGALNSGIEGEENGQVQVYVLEGDDWVQMGADIIPNQEYCSFGFDLSISANGQILAVGDPWSSTYGSISGMVKVYQFNEGDWEQMGTDLFSGVPLSFYGTSVDVSANGHTLAIGSPEEFHNGSQVGVLRIYHWIDNTWTLQGDPIYGTEDMGLFGEDIALSADGSTVAVGAQYQDLTYTNVGESKVFRWINSEWQQIGQSIEGEAEFDQSGAEVDLNADGSILAIGETHQDGIGHNHGRVRVFSFVGNSWVQMGQDIYGEVNSNLFGGALSLSGDGHSIAVGCRYNDVALENSGYAKMMQFLNEDWVLLGEVIYGENAFDYSGNAVSMNNDGTKVSIGSHANNDNAEQAGEVRIFRLRSPEISVLGNQNEINDGEGQITSVTGTDFQSICTNESAEMIFEINNLGEALLELSLPFQITGADAQDFQIISQADASILPGNSSSFVVQFTPSSSGVKSAQVNIENNDLDEFDFHFAIGGEGIAPAIGDDVQTACGEFTWINGLTYTSSAVDTFVLNNAAISGCDSIAVLHLSMTEFENTITNMGSYLSADQEAEEYQWIYCSNGGSAIQGANDSTYALSPSFLGEFAVVITIGDCVDTSDCVEVTSLNIEDLIQAETIESYPNPFRNALTISWQRYMSDLSLSVLDAKGREVYKMDNIDGTQVTFSPDLAPGIYFLHLKSEAIRFKSLKLLKE